MSTNSTFIEGQNLDQSDAAVFIFNQCLAATKERVVQRVNHSGTPRRSLAQATANLRGWPPSGPVGDEVSGERDLDIDLHRNFYGVASPAVRPPTGHYRTVAGLRTKRPQHGRSRSARLPVRGQLVPVVGRQYRLGYTPGNGPGVWCVLKALPWKSGVTTLIGCYCLLSSSPTNERTREICSGMVPDDGRNTSSASSGTSYSESIPVKPGS